MRRKYAKVFKTRREALDTGKKAIKKLKIVYGTRGGKIKSSQAKISALKTIGGYVLIAKRK